MGENEGKIHQSKKLMPPSPLPSLPEYRLYTVVPRLVKFIDQLTNWYVRSNRKRIKVCFVCDGTWLKDHMLLGEQSSLMGSGVHLKWLRPIYCVEHVTYTLTPSPPPPPPPPHTGRARSGGVSPGSAVSLLRGVPDDKNDGSLHPFPH